MKRIGTAALAAALVLTAAGSAGDKTAGGKQERIPGDARWDYGAWADDYLVVGTTYEAATRQVTWTLEARRKVPARSYKATFFDPDLLEMAAPEIRFEPAQAEYRKGARIRARIELPGKDVMQEVSKVRIDRVGDDPAP